MSSRLANSLAALFFLLSPVGVLAVWTVWKYPVALAIIFPIGVAALAIILVAFSLDEESFHEPVHDDSDTERLSGLLHGRGE